MEPKRPVPSLSTEGWITDNLKVFDNLLGHMFVSDRSHSTTCPGTITSFAAILQKYGNDISRLEDATQQYMEEYLRRYVPSTQVTVTSVEDEHVPSKFQLKITLSANNNGETINLVEGLDILDGKFKRVMDLNNG